MAIRIKRVHATSLGSLGSLGLTSLTILGLALAAPVGCSSTREGSSSGGSFDPDASADAGACGFRCSRDLKKVLKGCEGAETVIAECSANEGCGIDKCVSACDSAVLSKGSAGCGFWTLPPDDIEFGAGTCFAAMIANTWDRPVAITAEWGTEPLDISKSTYIASRASGEPVYTRLEGPLPEGQVALVFISQAKDLGGPDPIVCPKTVTPAIDVDPIKHGTTRTKAIHLKTDAPVAAYSIFPYGGAESYYPTATVLLPETSWDKTYIGVTLGMFGPPEQAYGKKRTMQIIAAEDDTQVSIRPNFELARGEGVEPATNGVVTTWALKRGEVLQFTQDGIKSGSPIQANRAIGLFGGAPCAFLPGNDEYCDLFQQQITPFSQWGNEYALVPFRSRIEGLDKIVRETVPWSLVGAVDGTELTWSPKKPPGAPDHLDAGQAMNFLTDAITSVKSQDKAHPFHAAVYMTGSTFGGGAPGRTLGDPDFVNMVPTDQFLDRYIFFADYTYPETSITVVRKKTLAGFKPVSLECGGEIDGWQPIGAGSDFEFTWIRLTTGFMPQKFPSGECGYGRHVIQSTGPFSVHVWGIGRDASYGYPGGMGSRPVNEAPPPIVK